MVWGAQGCEAGLHAHYQFFNVFVVKVTREARRKFVREVKLSTGDDMVIMAESKGRLQSNLQVLSEAMGRWDFKVNWKKTKVMKVA